MILICGYLVDSVMPIIIQIQLILQNIQTVCILMIGRRSLDPSNSKPFNINIYYNINSRNITNNHQVQSHPVTARVNRNLHDQSALTTKNDNKSKASGKTRKKKYSMDLGVPTEKKADKITKKSNSNSISSGFPSQINQKRDNQKNSQDKKLSNVNVSADQNERKLGELLQIFSEGKINKQNLTRQIINIFQESNKIQDKQKLITKKKRSESTLIGTSTPKNNNMYKFSGGTQSIKAVMGIHRARKRQSKSEKGSFTNSKQRIFKNQIAAKIIQCKGIDSSLFLQPDDEKLAPIIDRTNDVQTSYSIVLLNQNLKKQRQKFTQNISQSSIQNAMATKIQKAWKKYKTRQIIHKILNPPKQKQFCTDLNSLLELENIECISKPNSNQNQNQNQNQISNKTSISVQNFLSQQLQRKNNVKQNQIARVEQLRDHELRKWNQVINYVKTSIDNKSISTGQCLNQIIHYFQNAKKSVESQLMLGKFQDNRKLDKSREITVFTNQVFSKQVEKQEGILKIQDLQSEEQRLQREQSEEQQQLNNRKQQNRQQSKLIQQQSLPSSRIILNSKNEFFKSLQRQQNMSFQVIQSALLLNLKKIEQRNQQKIKKLDIHSNNYLQAKKKLQQKHKQQISQIKRIIKNLNKGYLQAKNILQKQQIIGDEQSMKSSKNSNSKQSLQKCKSDNYLLKTAINYKRYIQKKQKIQIQQKQKQKQKQKSQVSEDLQKKQMKKNKSTKAIKDQQNQEVQVESIDSQFKLNLYGKQQARKDEMLDNKSSPFHLLQSEGGQGFVSNTNCQQKFSKFQDNIVSQELLQYEQIHKRLDEQEQKQSISIQSHEKQSIAQQISLFQNNKINQINRKFKNLTKDDKDDIFQFLFIDLTLQLITEYPQQTKLYKSIKKYVQRLKRLESIPKGARTSLQSCKEYLNLLTKFTIQDYSSIFLKHINVPMGPTAKEMLRYMRQDEENQENLSAQDEEMNVPLILPVAIFEKVESTIVPQYPQYYEDQLKQASRKKFLRQVEHIHHKAIFDSLNENLDLERPYGVWGMPFPWKTTQKNNKNVNWDENKKIGKMKLAVNKVIQCCSCLCGIMVDKQQSVFGKHKISQNYLKQIRQDRMSRTLTSQLLESEQKWQFYDDQQVETLIQLSKLVTLHLMQQFVIESKQISGSTNCQQSRQNQKQKPKETVNKDISIRQTNKHLHDNEFEI